MSNSKESFLLRLAHAMLHDKNSRQISGAKHSTNWDQPKGTHKVVPHCDRTRRSTIPTTSSLVTAPRHTRHAMDQDSFVESLVGFSSLFVGRVAELSGLNTVSSNPRDLRVGCPLDMCCQGGEPQRGRGDGTLNLFFGKVERHYWCSKVEQGRATLLIQQGKATAAHYWSLPSETLSSLNTTSDIPAQALLVMKHSFPPFTILLAVRCHQTDIPSTPPSTGVPSPAGQG
jgi:hypothetical protein